MSICSPGPTPKDHDLGLPAALPAAGGGLEVERRFLVARVPHHLSSFHFDRIAQGYLALDPSGTQVRVRRRSHRTLLTIKTGRGLARTEVEFDIDERQFERLWTATEGRRIEKTRYRIPLEKVSLDGQQPGGHWTIELDVFTGALSGLVMAEVEFPTVEEAMAFRPPDWMRPEVTEDARYGNSQLACDGRPDPLAAGSSGLLSGEALTAGLLQEMQAQLRMAAMALQGPNPEVHADVIHGARKALKKARALTRVARTGLGEEVTDRVNALLREAGQRLSGARDAQVLIQTLDGILARSGARIDAAQVAPLREQLVVERHPACAVAGQDAIADVLELLERASASASEWTLGETPTVELAAGLKRILHQGRRALKDANAATGEQRTHALHELRKRSKDLWHATELLEVAHPKRMRALQNDAHALADLLGDDHDLAILQDRMESPPASTLPERPQSKALAAVIARRRRKLEAKALELAERIHGSRHRSLIRAVRRHATPPA